MDTDTRTPNILFIFTDQHRHNVMGCAGHALVRTPNLDRLAAEGTRFSNVWCQSPVCQPSRASVITGRYTEDLDLFSNTRDFDPSWPTVMHQLRGGGYETASIGKTHYHGMPARETIAAEAGPYDMGRYSSFVEQFGWDYVLEEFDKYVHPSKRLRTPYTDYLEKQGGSLLANYREQIKSVFRLTPEHWRGHTSVLPQEHDLTSFLAREALDWLSARGNNMGDGNNAHQPFLLKLAFLQPHVPLIDDPEWADYYRDAEIAPPELTPPTATNDTWQSYVDTLNGHSQAQMMDDAFIRNGIRHYLGMVSLIDQKVGEVLTHLEQTGELDNTWIVYTSDHGEMLGEHHLWAKMNFYKGAVQLPLIVRPPGGMQARVVDDLVELTDVTATLADIGGVSPPEGCRGHSLLPALEGQDVGREWLRSRINTYSAVRDDRYRLTCEVGSGTPCELFDLEADPGELNNRVEDAAMRATVEQMQKVALAL